MPFVAPPARLPVWLTMTMSCICSIASYCFRWVIWSLFRSCCSYRSSFLTSLSRSPIIAISCLIASSFCWRTAAHLMAARSELRSLIFSCYALICMRRSYIVFKARASCFFRALSSSYVSFLIAWACLSLTYFIIS